LNKSGSYGIKLYVTFVNESDTIEYVSEQITITISESSFSCPNAFSPNGDGINDVFKFNYKSIVKFEAVIFNRWGQKIHTMNLKNIDEGWDGRHGNDYVKDGVYFININAVGSDGMKYEIKKAINILKGFKETDGTGGA
jgi:gliding motility-associated-like protein